MIIKFLANYRGRETAMRRVDAGGVMEIDHQAAVELISLGIAEEVKEKEILLQNNIETFTKPSGKKKVTYVKNTQ